MTDHQPLLDPLTAEKCHAPEDAEDAVEAGDAGDLPPTFDHRPPRVWASAEVPAAAEQLVAAGIDPQLAPLLARRGVETADQAERFLNPSPDDLNDPFLLAGMEGAVARLEEAIAGNHTIAVVGDYDVDGVTATALLTAVLRAHKLRVEPIIPHRIREGYGFQEVHVERASELGAQLIVTVDCGTNSVAAVNAALDASIDVIVTDHHIPGPEFPARAHLINPQRPDCSYPFDQLCGAGLALKLVQALCQRTGRNIPLAPLLRMTCLGTVADVVPLIDENRVITTLGLRALNQNRAIGLAALIEVSRVRPPLKSEDIGFRLGPRINAAGRLDSADEALELLLCRDPERARELAARLDLWNQERQDEEALVVEQARERFSQLESLPGILFAWSEQWHRGVVGIAAGRIARDFHRPTVLLAVDGDSATGSGRSIPGVSLHEFLVPFRDRYERFGGHDFAIGMTVRTEELEALKSDWEATAHWPQELLERRYQYELSVPASGVTPQLHDKLAQLEPHGPRNSRPLLRVGPLTLEGPPSEFGKGHLKVRASGIDGGGVWLLGWRWQERRADLAHDRFEAVGYLDWDSYLGWPVLTLSDVRAL